MQSWRSSSTESVAAGAAGAASSAQTIAGRHAYLTRLRTMTSHVDGSEPAPAAPIHKRERRVLRPRSPLGHSGEIYRCRDAP